MFYSGQEEFLEGTLPFVRDALAAGEPIMVAVDPLKADLLRAELNGDGDSLHFVDMLELGRNPARIIPAWRDFVADHLRDGAPVRGIGEPIWPGRTPAELVECQRHEWLLNLAFGDAPAWWLLCPYDVEGLDPEVLEAARLTHPHLAHDGSSETSEAYRDPHLTGDPFHEPLPPPVREPKQLRFTLDELAAVRELVERTAGESLDDDRLGDLLVAVNEAATNSVRHAGGTGMASVWCEDSSLLCELRDAGHIDEPLAGRRRPELGQLDGRGLWLMNQLCDLAQIRSGPGGNVVRLHMSLAPA